MRVFFVLLLLFSGLSDVSAKSEALKQIDVGAFSIELPAGWKYVPQFGTDSFVGEFHGDGVELAFDYSPEGYSWRLPQSKDSYLSGKQAEWIPTCAFCKPGTIYTTARDLEAYKAEKLKELGPVEFSKMKYERFPPADYSIEIKSDFDPAAHKAADYVGVLVKPSGERLEVDIKLPDEIKYTETTWRETTNFHIGTAVSTLAEKGTTGVFHKDKNSNFTFVLSTSSAMSIELQQKLLESFKTIKFKNYKVE